MAEPGSDEYIEKVFYVTFLTGLIFIVMGLLRLGYVVNFFSKTGNPQILKGIVGNKRLES